MNLIHREKSFLSAAECLYYADLIKHKKDDWFSTSYMTTLGGAIYAYSPEEYAEAKKGMDDPLFNPLLNKLRDFYNTEEGSKPRYDSRFSRCGFHILDDRYKECTGKIHIDIPYTHHPYLHKIIKDGGSAFSFTLPIELPENSLHGINYWGRGSAKKGAIGVVYNVGEIITHDGLSLHQIATHAIKPNEHRITLQGHAVKKADKSETILFF